MSYRDGISCIIVSYKSLGTLGKCLYSLESQQGVDLEIVVIDNNSGDGTADFLKNAAIKHVILKKNRGFGAAVNLGAGMAQYKYLFILNPDTTVPQGSLEKMTRIAESETDLGILAPALVYPDGSPQFSARSLPGRREIFFGRGSPLYKFGITGDMEAGYIYPEEKYPVKIPAVSATAIMIRTELFKSLGGFDERFFMYMEDIDLCRRIREKGLSITLLPDVKITHSWRQSSSKRPFFSAYHHHLSVLKYFIKYDKNRFIMNLFLAISLGLGLVFSIAVIISRRVFRR